MDTRMVVTYIVIDLFCIIMAVSMSIHIDTDFGSEFEIKTLRTSLYCYCGFLIFGLVWLLTQYGYIPYVRPVVWIANMFSLILLIAVDFFWYLFAYARLGKNRSPNKIIMWILIVPLIAAAVFDFSSPLTGWAFTIDADRTYRHGPFFFYLSIVGYLYDILALFASIHCLLHEKQREKRKQAYAIGVFIFFPMLAGALQLSLSGTPILAPAILTSFFIVFVNIQSSQVYNDALTGLNNRKRAHRFLEEQIQLATNDKPLTVYMLDVNSFKKINDQYGHIEGDHALKIIAASLMELCRKYHVFTARYGGDEFIIITNYHIKESPETIVTAFKEILQSMCETHNTAYPLTVSIGYAVVTNSTLSLETAISTADQALYVEKRKFHVVNK
jgi:diguanylate cyclase (GGDEF)-like protein